MKAAFAGISEALCVDQFTISTFNKEPVDEVATIAFKLLFL
jgi:hypothetical protein